jgi:RNA polymerase sigma factor (sigma-70 family)
MKDTDHEGRLSRIETCWTLVFQAHASQKGAVAAAQQVLVQRYCGAVYRYLLASLRNPDAAEEVAQEFALRFVRGDFRRADPERGRFRDFVKTTLYHLIVDYHRRRQGQPQSLPGDSGALPAVVEDVNQAEQLFVERWREELLDLAWTALKAVEHATGQLFYTVLRWRSEHPDAPATELAEQLSARTGKRCTDFGIRQTLHRARAKFATLLLDEVSRSLETTAPERLEQELIELGLLPYCRSALERRRSE